MSQGAVQAVDNLEQSVEHSCPQLSGYGHTADNLSIGGASVSNVGNTSSLKLDSGSVSGYNSQLGSAETASLSNVDLRHNTNGSSAQIGNLSANNVKQWVPLSGTFPISNTSMGTSSNGSNLSVGQATVK